MATNGNHPAPTSTPDQQRLQAVAEAIGDTKPIGDLISRAEGLLQYMEAIGRELGNSGGADERDVSAFVDAQRKELYAFVRKLVGRYRRRADELDRVMGKVPE